MEALYKGKENITKPGHLFKLYLTLDSLVLNRNDAQRILIKDPVKRLRERAKRPAYFSAMIFFITSMAASPDWSPVTAYTLSLKILLFF